LKQFRGASSTGRAIRSENGFLLAAYDIKLDENGFLKSSHRLVEGEIGENVWYAYVETNPDGSPWFNGQTYVDTLSKDAMAYFIHITHETYKDKLEDKFGTVVPCIFTDEPQMATKTALSGPRGRNDVFFPWTGDLTETFIEACGIDLVENLPELVWNLPDGKASATRYHFHDHTCERFVSAFLDQIGTWCKQNKIILDGHMMEEPSLWSQTTALGEAMRCYRSMGMPGMDLLLDRVEYNTAKQVSSVSRQNGTRGAMCEIYGVTHWYFTFEGHKGCGDWQAALGITFRVHHLTWVSMAGEGKRDYPACIGYQSPWYKEYGYVEDHFARLGVVLTRGRAITQVGVIHPIESYWLGFGPNNSGDEQWRRDSAFWEMTNWLLHGLIDFDFIAESLLPRQVGEIVSGKKLAVGKCEYDVIIVPNLRTIRSTTLKVLQAFAKAGGKVIIAGSSPSLVDARVPTHIPVIDHSESVFWSQQNILSAVERYRDIRVDYEEGSRSDSLLYQMREDANERFTFICNTDRNSPVNTKIFLKGLWQVNVMDTFTGDEHSVKTSTRNGWTMLPYRFEGCASVLLRQYPISAFNTAPRLPCVAYGDISASSDIILDSVELSEPNVLLLDYAEYRLGDGNEDWAASTEVLQIDNIIRGHLGLPYKGEAWKQPWAIPQSEREPTAFVTLRFMFESGFAISETTMLALENAEAVTIHVNDTFIPSINSTTPLGWWVDEEIKTVPIPGHIIRNGTNTVTLGFPFGILTNIERIYLLGDFFVSFHDRRTTLLKPLDLSNFTWGDITSQGFPFYVGNITYNCRFPIQSSNASAVPIALSVPQFSSPVLKVSDLQTERKIGHIALQPHMLPLGRYKAGVHKVAITAFGNRYNSFGHIHLPDNSTNQCGPYMWRTGGDWWTPDYYVKPIGVLERPKIVLGVDKDAAEHDMDEKGDEWVIVRRSEELS
jgi:hypothetical protein